MKNPEITIIIPTYNRAGLIGQAIESILWRKASKIGSLSSSTTLHYTMRPKKSSKKIASNDPGGRIRFLKNETNLGISKTRNRGLREARGTYIAMLDSDDIWLDPEKLAKQAAAFKTDAAEKTGRPQKPPYSIVGTWITLIDESGKAVRNVSFATADSEIRKSFLYKNHIMQSSILFLKKAALEAGGYDEKMVTMEDHDLWLRIGTKYEVMTLPIYATGYRIHAGSISKNRKKQVALDEMLIMRRWKNSYPGFIPAFIRAYLLLLRAYF